MKPVFEIADHLTSGALIEVAAETPPINAQLACLYPHKRLQDPKSRLFIDFTVQEMRKSLAAQGRGRQIGSNRARAGLTMRPDRARLSVSHL